MATRSYSLQDVPELDRQISDLSKKAGDLQGNLNSSPTALGGLGMPTPQDVATQTSLEKIQGSIQSLNDSRLRARWYKPLSQTASGIAATEGEGDVHPGVIGTTLDWLAKPARAVVGATEHLIGQGKGSLYQDIADNMQRNKDTFSDVLRTSGVPGAISAPLGFALDVAMDPVNWFTMGTSAIVPRLGMGILKGAEEGNLVRGLAVAGESGALEKATAVGRYIPYFNKSATFAKMGERAIESTQAWEKLTGITAEELVLQKGMGVGRYRVALGDLINQAADATPGGRSLLDTLWYSPKEWVRQSHIKDILASQLKKDVNLEEAFAASHKGEDMTPYMRNISKQHEATIAAEQVSDKPIDWNAPDSLETPMEVDTAMAKVAASAPDVAPKIPAMAKEVTEATDDAYTAAHFPEIVMSEDPIENAARIASEVTQGSVSVADIEKIVRSGALNESGIKWFDNMMTRAKAFDRQIIGSPQDKYSLAIKGKAILDAYDAAMGLFRVGKVALSPTSYTNAIIGNMIMTHMANGDIGPEFLKTLKLSYNFYMDKPGAVQQVEELLFKTAASKGVRDPEMERFFREFQTGAKGTFGLDLLDKKTVFERASRAAHDAGIVTSKTNPAEFKSKVDEAVSILEEATKREPKAGTSMAMAAAHNTGASGFDRGGGMLSTELFSTKASSDMFKTIEDNLKKDPTHKGWQALNLIFNKAPSQYEKIDQIYKLTTFLRATTRGYTLDQIRQMRHIIDISPEEMTLGRTIDKAAGQIRYKLQPRTALELANEMYLNYAAMPAAIRVMRNFPLLGSPFVSFMYGMALKTGQTIAYNPSAFNKVTFGMQDFGGSTTPLEKKALSTQYYSYLKQPGMMRLPFFTQNPIYVNLSSAIPYYSLNMFAPDQTTYGNSPREILASVFQKSPLMKDPIGSVLFDYMIQPLILGDAARPQGQFGQALYPLDASALEKVGYGTRSLVEGFMPAPVQYLGYPVGLMAPGATDFLPSYRGRAISRALQGPPGKSLNQIGISSKEGKVSRTLREGLKTLGVSVQPPVNTSFNQGQ